MSKKKKKKLKLDDIKAKSFITDVSKDASETVKGGGGGFYDDTIANPNGGTVIGPIINKMETGASRSCVEDLTECCRDTWQC